MSRLVLDTNVWVSGLVYGGRLGELIDLAFERQVSILISRPLLEELRGVLSRPRFQLDPDDVESVIGHIRRFAILVPAGRPLSIVKADPPDNRILECALAGKAEAILTGDQHLLRIAEFRGIPIIEPGRWLSSNTS